MRDLKLALNIIKQRLYRISFCRNKQNKCVFFTNWSDLQDVFLIFCPPTENVASSKAYINFIVI